MAKAAAMRSGRPRRRRCDMFAALAAVRVDSVSPAAISLPSFAL
jgi:hypothetical protein